MRTGVEHMDSPFVLIRQYKPEDQKACKEIIGERIGLFTGPMFVRSLFRETVYEVIVFIVAIAFIFLGVPITISVLFVPVVFLGNYFAIRMSNGVKGLEMSQEFAAMENKYSRDRGGKFFVAELCESNIRLLQDLDKSAVSSLFFLLEGNYNEATFYPRIQGSRKRIIGMVGVCSSERDPRRAFMKRLLVRPPYRQTVVEERLVNAVLQHCRDFGFLAVDTVCSEVNDELRESLFACGFEVGASYHKYALGLISYMGMMQFSAPIKASRSALEA
ncbi:unnamed protein product [Notodromas monacha]|uniref:N-acetyltransferase domain-containing protein n=1 Tax=Notodromas monacha TaxID=399045 RepID=A0A7R9GG53_9CRUS|nr:unnamed protein product [Notodromas monacha]CAG0919837.1 unnamed protein product [Notodromas monacha]